ncbi:ABC transporter permease/substrate-binding protein [Aggregatibacter actinomycetemcomitans]|uniref:ABC transporter permease/substrate-binding protein n=1 Tax=Aggregatibacter actinomycetemcomitans TaxID=714 RepID=UPI0011DD16A7|nr:ABC transporter permease/substrate-binding protein [Aggregatibacter actinomycetemcomitans]QEH46100.1 ABC transporter permease/substrate-binding protein [Aggregatibacter actinomycetemcomitans]
MLEMLPFTLPEVGAMLLTHLWLSLSALLIAVVIAVPIAVLLSRKRHMAEIVLQFTNVLQTIPSLALLGLLIPFVGIGSPPVLIALTLYALLPIFQNTYLGLSQIDQSIQDAYTAFGLSRWQSLWRIELPMALPAMMSGIRTAAVLIIGTATLAALIGAGGLGSLILLGIDRNNMVMIFTGALLSALLAVGVSGLIAILQKVRCKRPLAIVLILGLSAVGFSQISLTSQTQKVVIAGKLGSEPDILINMYKLLIEQENKAIQVELKPNFGKTSFLFNALNSGEIDIYPEFTGTVLEALVQVLPEQKNHHRSPETTYQLSKQLLAEQFRLEFLPPMAYQNTYALAVKEAYGATHGLATISDLHHVAGDIRAGFTLEFLDRIDGYKGIKSQGITLVHIVTLEPALRYTALLNNKIDLIEAFSTDAELKQHQLRLLKDDINLFPAYQGAPLMKADFAAKNPQVLTALNRLANRISEQEMSEMNYQVKVLGESPEKVAREYLKKMKLL